MIQAAEAVMFHGRYRILNFLRKLVVHSGRRRKVASFPSLYADEMLKVIRRQGVFSKRYGRQVGTLLGPLQNRVELDFADGLDAEAGAFAEELHVFEGGDG